MPSDLSTLSRGELVTVIYQQASEIEILKQVIIDLQERIKPQSGQDSPKVVPPFVKANVKKSKRKKKAKKREHGFARLRETPTQQVFHGLECCPNCQGILGKPSVAYTRQIINIPIAHYEVIEHVIFKSYCFSCRERFSPKVDLSSFVLGKGRFGINIISAVFALREEQNMTINQIQAQLKTFYQLRLSVGQIVEILHQESDLGKNEVGKIKQKLLSSNVIYADETGGRENGINGYHWSFSNQKYQLLIYDKSRSAKVVQGVLGVNGEDFEGVLSTDFYAAYNEYLGPHQRCWVHYHRDMKKLKVDNPKDRKLAYWIRSIHKLYEEAKSYPGPDPNLGDYFKEQERIQKEQYFQQKLNKLCEPHIKTQLPQAKLAARAIRFMPEMFSFIRYEGVNSDNNMAERAVRKTVIKRKISFGTRSKRGSETRSILGSLFGTWRLQNLNPFEQMRLLLLSPPCQ